LSLENLRAALGENQARTHPEHPDGTLRGRTYAIPFARVWTAVFEMASTGLRGWRTVEADEDRGILLAECQTVVFRLMDDVEIRICLDENAQTRVDVSSSSRSGRGDLGRNQRRIRRFFRLLDRRIGAGPGKILDPTIPLIRTSLLLLGVLFACGPADHSQSGGGAAADGSMASSRNFQARSYERHIVFLTAQGDSTLLVPWSFTARTTPEGVSREVRGWLARSNTWDPFLSEAWEGPPNAAPWRPLPHGPLRLVVGLGDALETIIFQEGGRNLEVNLGDLLVEWSGRRAQTYRVHEGAVVLADQTVAGHLLDMSRAWATADTPPGDWGFLLSGDTLQVVMEDLAPDPGPEGGAYSFWARVEFLERQWQRVRLTWSEVMPFETARRDVPMSWEIQSAEGDLTGRLTTLAPFLEVEEGEGPMLPVDALFEVAGTLTLAGRDFPVRGFIRHLQR
jgi:hypothetical protein